MNFIKFNPYNIYNNMPRLPIYELFNNSSINLFDLLNKYISKYKTEDISSNNYN